MKKTQSFWDRYKEWIKKTFPGKTPTVLEQWDFIMVFEERYKEEIDTYFQKYSLQVSKENKFKVIAHQKEQQILVLIRISEQQVYHHAEELKMLKRKQKKSFGFDLKTINREIYLAEQNKKNHLCNYLKWIRARLMPENQKIYMQEQYSVFNRSKFSQYLPNEESYDMENNPLFTPDEELRCKFNYLLSYNIKQQSMNSSVQHTQIFPFYDIMRHAGFKQLVPIHKDSKYGRVIVGNIKQYLGANSQTYFSFVAFLQKWLIFPTVIGLLTFIYNSVFQFTADDSPADFLYAFFIMIWSIIFYTQWQHKQKWTKACEVTGYSDDWSQFSNIIDREGRRWRESRLSGQKQQYIPFFQRVWRYFASFTVCVSVLFATLYFMVLSLNARGFVDENHKFLHVDWISAWAQPGGMFDANTSWGQVPNLVHVLVVNIFDQSMYRPLAKRFTKFQQHFSSKSYENSVIIKFFIYEYIITFADLFYIAFVRMDIIGLRQQLLSLFFIDIIRRLIAELLIPKLASIKRSYSMKAGDPSDQEHQLASQAILQVNKDQYEPFDDYLQIVTNFGYLVMLSACFPLAPLLILIAHSIESIQDKYKIIHIFKRKLPSKYVGMGYWNKIVLFLCYTAIITNILLFAFSSHQIVAFFPKLYESGKDILFGNAQISDIVTNAASTVIQSISNSSSLLLNQVLELNDNSSLFGQFMEPQVLNPFEQSCDAGFVAPPLTTSFLAPAQQKQTQFITILFVIEHFFLMLFMCLYNVLSKQKCDADVLAERRQIKRSIKKYFTKHNVIEDNYRGSVLQNIIQKNQQAEQREINESLVPGAFANLFEKTFRRSAQSTDSQGSGEGSENKEKGQ